MTRPVTIPNIFATQTGNIPLSQLDTNFTALANAINDPTSIANYAVDAGAVNALAVTLNPAPASLASMVGVPIEVKVLVTNTGAATLNVNSFGAITILKGNATGLVANDLVAGNIATFVYNGTNFFLQNAGNVLTSSTTPFTAQQYFANTNLTDAATIAWDVSANQVATFTFVSSNRTMGAPTNLVNGGFYALAVIQNAGSNTLTWNAVFKWAGGSAPTLSTAAGAKDYFTFRSDGTNLYEQGRALGDA